MNKDYIKSCYGCFIIGEAHFAGMVQFHLPLKGKGHCKSIQMILSDHLYPTTKHFNPDGSGLIQDDKAPINRTRGVTEWFAEYESDSHLYVYTALNYKELMSLHDLIIYNLFKNTFLTVSKLWSTLILLSSVFGGHRKSTDASVTIYDFRGLHTRGICFVEFTSTSIFFFFSNNCLCMSAFTRKVYITQRKSVIIF